MPPQHTQCLVETQFKHQHTIQIFKTLLDCTHFCSEFHSNLTIPQKDRQKLEKKQINAVYGNPPEN